MANISIKANKPSNTTTISSILSGSSNLTPVSYNSAPDLFSYSDLVKSAPVEKPSLLFEIPVSTKEKNFVSDLTYLGLNHNFKVHQVGSSVLFNPEESPFYPNDIDLLVLNSKKVQELLFEYDLTLGGSVLPEATFNSYRFGKINLIVASTEELIEQFTRATSIVKKLYLVDKQDRINVHDYIMNRKTKMPTDVFINLTTGDRTQYEVWKSYNKPNHFF